MRAALPLLLALLAAAPARAQLGIGGQVGTPTGVSLAFGQGPGTVLVAAGWDLGGDDGVEVEGHYLLRDRRLAGSQTRVRVFYGPGAFIASRDDDTEAGVSFGVGLAAPLVPELEAYGLLSPRLQLVDETDFDLGAALGLRFLL
jgi:hypothetical protein